MNSKKCEGDLFRANGTCITCDLPHPALPPVNLSDDTVCPAAAGTSCVGDPDNRTNGMICRRCARPRRAHPPIYNCTFKWPPGTEGMHDFWSVVQNIPPTTAKVSWDHSGIHVLGMSKDLFDKLLWLSELLTVATTAPERVA